MRHPLNSPKPCSYFFWQPTWYSPHHLGQDYVCSYVNLYAPCDGEITKKLTGDAEGNCIWFRDKWGKMWRFMHLNKFYTGIGGIKEGDLIAQTGQTGWGGLHLHIDIWTSGIRIAEVKNTWNKNLLYDPEIYIANKINEEQQMKFDNQELLSANGVMLYNVKPDECGGNNTVIELVGKDTYIDSSGVQYAKIMSMIARQRMNFTPKPIEWKDPKTLELENQIIDLKEKLNQKLADQAFIDNLKGMISSIIDWVKGWKK